MKCFVPFVFCAEKEGLVSAVSSCMICCSGLTEPVSQHFALLTSKHLIIKPLQMLKRGRRQPATLCLLIMLPEMPLCYWTKLHGI